MRRKVGRNQSRHQAADAPRTAAKADVRGARAGTPGSQRLLPGARWLPQVGVKQWLFAAAILMAVFLVYQPAWHGGVVWDDDCHITPLELQSWQGLGRIWFTLSARPQYYPLLHSAFWLEHRLWGDSLLGYHLVNILLHGLAALLVAAVLCRLKVPGAYLAAAIFALHPVAVESVAWITELKNTLSAVFYLSAAYVYLHFDESRSRRAYAAALALFILGLLSKTVTATLPGALLVVFWWQRGRLSWRKDVLPLVPFFTLGAVAGVFTAWVERALVGAEGKAYVMSLLERGLLAGRVIWFYLSKLVWPSDLLFIYPRWNVSAVVWWQYLFTAGVLALLTALWLLRRRSRAPLAGMLFFIGTLVPVLGIFNVYPFIYSFVADHFQYLASLGIITLAAAGIAAFLARHGLWNRPAGYGVCLALLAPLAILTWRQCGQYADAETLYRTTIARNPECWMAYDNLGCWLDSRGENDEAMACYKAVLKIKPDHAKAHFNLGGALALKGRLAEAISHFQTAVAINPEYVEAFVSLGVVQMTLGRLDAAVASYRKALAITPDNPTAHYHLANVLLRQGKFAEAVDQYDLTLQESPDMAEVHNNLGIALVRSGRTEDALVQFQEAVKLTPDAPEAQQTFGAALMAAGRIGEAVSHFRQALKLRPQDPEASQCLRAALAEEQHRLQKLADAREAIRLHPNDVALLNDTAWTLATSPEPTFRRATDAVEFAGRAATLAKWKDPAVLDTLAAAYAEAGQFDHAVKTAQEALRLAIAQKKAGLADGLRARLKLYQASQPYRATP